MASAGQWRWSLNSDGGEPKCVQPVATRDDAGVGIDDGYRVYIGNSTCRGTPVGVGIVVVVVDTAFRDGQAMGTV